MRNRHDLSALGRFSDMIVKTVLGIAVIVLAVTTVYFAMTQRIIMQPPFKIDRPMVIDWDEEVDQETVERMGEFMTGIFKNVTPKNVHKQHEKLLSLVPSSQYDDVNKMLQEDEDSIIRNAVVRVFHIGNIDASTKGQIKIFGTERLSVNGKEISKAMMNLTWHYDFTPADGFILLGYTEESK